MARNDDPKVGKCAACESKRPGIEGGGGGGISTGGFTFAGKPAAAAAAPVAGGFSFAGKPAAAAADEGLSAEGKKAARVFDETDAAKTGSLDVASMWSVLLGALNESFYSPDSDEQCAKADPSGSGKITRANFIQWYDSFCNDDDGDEADAEEIAEEMENAENAFDEIDASGEGSIDASNFGEVLDAMGTTYCDEDYGKFRDKLAQGGGKIKRGAFVAWYVAWIFAEEEDDDEEEDGDGDGGPQDSGGLSQSVCAPPKHSAAPTSEDEAINTFRQFVVSVLS
jgi:Ca2+-binding EF-hand superfamily protein